MDQMAIADRRQLRRKVSFWRIVALLLVLVIGFSLFRFFAANDRSMAPHVAHVTISGLITDNTELLERLADIEKSDSARALIVSISSGGGTTYGGERIFKAIRAVSAKKPVVSDIRTLAASAGYMIATAGDTIVAGDSSITGSIGVIFQYPQVKELMDKVGVSLEEIKSSPMKAEPSPFHNANEDAKVMIRNMVMDSYGWFVDLVADRRKLPRDEVLKLADGAIFTGRQALAVKLIDTLGGQDEIRAYLKTRDIPEDLPMVDWEAPKKRSPLSLFAAVSQLINMLGYGDVLPSSDLMKLGGEKLFLDGLVSVWQVGRD